MMMKWTTCGGPDPGDRTVDDHRTGRVVGTIVIAMFMPMIQIITTLGSHGQRRPGSRIACPTPAGHARTGLDRD